MEQMTLGEAVIKIAGDDTQFERDLGRVEKRGSSIFSRIGGLAKGAFIGAAAGMSALAGVTVFAGFKMEAQLEKANLQFETLLGSADKAKKHVAGLFEFAAQTPFETGPIIEASRLMLTFGGEALATQENLKLVGDAAAIAGSGIDEIAFWFGRAYAAIQGGQPFGEASMRLMEMGIMSAESRAKLEELQKAGAGADEIWAELTSNFERFDGAMIKQAGTWEGLTSTITDNLQMAAGTAVKPFFNLVKEGMGKLAEFVQSETFTGWAEKVAEVLQKLINRGKVLFKDISGDFRDAFNETGSVIEGAKAALGRLLAILTGGEMKDAGGAVSALGSAFALIAGGPIGVLIKELLPELLELAKEIGPLLADIAMTIGPILIELIGELADILLPALKTVLERVTDLVSKHPELVYAIVAAWAAFKIGTIVMGLYSMVAALWAKVTAMGAATVATHALKAALVTTGIGALVIGLATAAYLLYENWDTVVAFFKEHVIPLFTETLPGVFNKFKDFLFGHWQEILSVASLILLGPAGLVVLFTTNAFGIRDKVVGAFAAIPAKLLELAEDFLAAAKWLGGMIAAGFKIGVNSAIGFLNDLIGGLETAVNAVAGALNAIPGFEIPGWVPKIGGKGFEIPDIPTIDIPPIPTVAKGAVVEVPTVALLGEGGEPEIVSPISLMRRIVQEALAAGGAGARYWYQYAPIVLDAQDRGVDEALQEVEAMIER